MNGPNATYAPTSLRSSRNLSWVGPALVLDTSVIIDGRIADLCVVNAVEDAVDVDVKQPGGPWMPLAAVEPQSTTTVYDVVDTGGPWVLRFKVADEVLATMQVSHERLARGNWRVVVPTLVT